MANKVKAKPKKNSNPGGVPQVKYPGDIGYTEVSGPQVSVDPLKPTDTTFNYDQVTVDPITGSTVSADKITADKLSDHTMQAADYTIVDPSQISSQYGDIARTQMRENSKLSSELALEALDTELKGLQSFAPAAAALQRGEVAKDNLANQAMRDAQLATADPMLRQDLMSQADRARALASGRLPSSIDDRAFELGIRSSAADAAALGGFGAKSGAARKASELMSAAQRLDVSKYGDQLLTSNIANRNSLLLAPTEYANAGSQISAVPTQSAAQVATSLMGQLNDKTIISSTDALTNLTGQEQFKSKLQQEANITNVQLAADKDLNQAKLNLDAQSTNAANSLQAGIANQQNSFQVQQANATNAMSAAEINARNAIATQSTAMQIRSDENKFASTMDFNVKNANADRAFNAANANAGRALQVAVDNRSTRVQIDSTNKQMIFQDQQARKAEAAANARAAMAERGANARAAMAAGAQSSAAAANLQAQREAFLFQYGQQQQANAAAEQGRRDAQRTNDVAAGVGIVTRLPQIISGANSIISLFGGGKDVSSLGDGSSLLDTTANLDIPEVFSFAQ